MHLVYWTATHPVNDFWLKDQELEGAGARFFSFGAKRSDAGGNASLNWQRLRDRWEYSHVVRAVFALLGLLLLTIGVTM